MRQKAGKPQLNLMKRISDGRERKRRKPIPPDQWEAEIAGAADSRAINGGDGKWVSEITSRVLAIAIEGRTGQASITTVPQCKKAPNSARESGCLL